MRLCSLVASVAMVVLCTTTAQARSQRDIPSSWQLQAAQVQSKTGQPTTGQPQSTEKTRSTVQQSSQQPQRVPMVFYVARGGANACGEGCDEWIAAEGYIDLGAAQRLKKFLERNAGANRPIYFSSPGGLLADALAIGRLLRARGMTAGIGVTVPLRCVPIEKEDACRAVKHSGSDLAADLHSLNASCNSACVYAFLGAAVRQIPPGAQIGVHSGRLVNVAFDGRVRTGSTVRSLAGQKAKTAEFEAQLRRYTAEMGVDPGLLDLALKTPFEQIRYLSRDEIARFGVDSRGFQETRWTATDLPKTPRAVFKLLTEAKGADGKEYRTSLIRLVCRNSTQVSLAYVRGLTASDAEHPTAIKVTLGGHDFTFPRVRGRFQNDSLDTGATFDTRQISVPIEYVEAAAAGDSIDITEIPAGDAKAVRVSKLSTAGLRGALDTLRQECND